MCLYADGWVDVYSSATSDDHFEISRYPIKEHAMSLVRLVLTITVSPALLTNISAQVPIYELTKYLDVGTQVPGADPGVLFTCFDGTLV